MIAVRWLYFSATLVTALAGCILALSVTETGSANPILSDAGHSDRLPSPSGPGKWHVADGVGEPPERLHDNAIEAPAGAQAVIGPDSRFRISPTAAFPFSAIAQLDIVDHFGNLIGCTGTLVGPDTVLTAAHCLWDLETSTWAFAVFVVPAADAAYQPFGYQAATAWWVPDAYVDHGAREFDWGILKLPNTQMSSRTRWMQIGVLNSSTLLEPDFYPAIVGYPGDKPPNTMWASGEARFDFVDPLNLYHSVDAFHGQSGSAVWSVNDKKFYFGYVVGIHSRGNSVVNVASRIGPMQMADILEGCRQMQCTVDYRVQATTTATPTATSTPTRTPTPTQRATQSPTATGSPSGGSARRYRAILPQLSAGN